MKIKTTVWFVIVGLVGMSLAKFGVELGDWRFWAIGLSFALATMFIVD